ncbi:hypothetical protein AB840_14525 [Megasphaera cerevisiae DSM 20462]|uniref:Serine protease n=1 Tax=Megasphaera cerevisiae DSM 20462 TaxID=1122219 RepID=A0A0J6WSY1_9FIRM|nr:serine protease [Megasphaera cerevisiae]KMO85263.1 hypothetical protein AB840_14525 [Megasphaera cerevisiae DSM 20462]OKY52372.1 hypothetical protein BSR42_13230 [Megasphaera cerevisiae]SKA25817.1 hypothetical protein SAMN05660900_03062 [Megasphaera cerevisiae DSM 20462]
MKLDISEFTGKITDNEVFVGSGFLIDAKCFITARHNLISPLQDEVDEKWVSVDIGRGKTVRGKTLNLKQAYEKNIDCVFICLEDEVLDTTFTKIVIPTSATVGLNYAIYGYPKERVEGIEIKGTVASDAEERSIDFVLNVDKIDKLQSYKGLSGAPIVINGFIVGIVLQQETSEQLYGISFKRIKESFPEFVQTTEEKELKKVTFAKNISLEEKLNFNFFQTHIEEATRIAGPRYTKELTIENKTLNDLMIFSQEKMIIDNFKALIEKLEEYPKRLAACFEEERYTKAMLFSQESYMAIEGSKKFIRESLGQFRKIVQEGISFEAASFFENLDTVINDLIKELECVFAREVEIFESKNGVGTYNNQNWRGWMAAYQCEFPCANLDTIKEMIVILKKVIESFRTNPVKLYFSNNLLLSGKGGIGKTHSMCDLVWHNIQEGTPSLLFFGQYFKNMSPEETILEKLSLKEVNFDELLYYLDLVGDRLGTPIIICIDALNETTDKTYWNSYLNSLIEDIKKYKNIKLIITCRTIYLSEVLSEEIISKFVQIEHTGFVGVESQAIEAFFKYYDLKIPSADKMQVEYTNPLFLKLYCETLVDTKEAEQVLDIDGFGDLIERFLRVKNEKISKKFSDYISPRENIILGCIDIIGKNMYREKTNALSWSKIKESITCELQNKGITDSSLSKQLLDELIAEHILKESSGIDNTISFSFERFYDYVIAKNIFDRNHEEVLEEIENLFKNLANYRGVLEIVAILYKEKYDKELETFFREGAEERKKIWLKSLAWRKSKHIDITVKEKVLNILLYQAEFAKDALMTMLELSLKKNISINADCLHGLLQQQQMVHRDLFLGYVMLKAHEKHTIINRLLKNAIYIENAKVDVDIVKMWELALGWFTCLNDIYTRDLASKGLVNLLKIYPETIFYLIDSFSKVNDEYIQERIWGAINASLILNNNKEKLVEVTQYIYKNFVQPKKFPVNVMIRDYLRNIGEFAQYKSCLEYNINEFRPPYESSKVKKMSSNYIKRIKERYPRLYWNCTKSDFAIYTIPEYVGDYGFSKEEIGNMIYNEIIEIGYSKKHEELDGYIDYTYGALRNRDGSVERIGKKYQKIALYRVLGSIIDNYEFKSRHRYDDEPEIIPKEQGNGLRKIDLSCIPYTEDGEFVGTEFKYDFRRTNKLSYMDWFSKDDIKNEIKTVMETEFNNQKYLLLKGYFSTSFSGNVLEKYPMREVWMHVYSFLVKNEDLAEIKKWIKEDVPNSEWLSHGDSSFYEGWVAEYPWSASYVNVLDYYDEAHGGFGSNKIPVKIIPTVNDYNNEKDSPFLPFDIGGRLLLPCRKFFDDLQLVWDGKNQFLSQLESAFINGKNKGGDLFINQEILDKYLNQHGLSLIWVTRGEKQVITGNSNFEGRAEFSESYVYEENSIVENHYYVDILKPHC